MAIQRLEQDIVIASGTTSRDITLADGEIPVALICPASIASVTFTVTMAPASTPTTFTTLYKNGADMPTTIAASKTVRLDPLDFLACKILRFIFNASETTKTFKLVTATGL